MDHETINHDEVVELNLSQTVSITNTGNIRESVKRRMIEDGLACPAVELMRFHVLVYCTRGSGKHMVDFEDHELRPGTAIWIRPGQVQQWSDVDDHFDADVAVFQSSSVPDLPLFDHLLGATAISHLGNDTDRIERQMAWMAEDLEATNDQATAASVVAVLLRLFARNIDDQDAQRQSPSWRLATDFVASIDENIAQRSVAWHATQVGASTRSVARATAESLGQRPKEVLDSRIILEAQRRLAWSDDDIATVARSLSFSEASNFTKFFRRRTGVAPSEFRDVERRANSTSTEVSD